MRTPRAQSAAGMAFLPCGRTSPSTTVPEAAATTRWGTRGADLGAGVAAQLRTLDVDVHALGGCTLEDDRFFSHRREAPCGRMATLIWLENRDPKPDFRTSR